MKIACEACGAKYTIADDKVRGRKVKIRCKGCGTPIVVDGAHGGGPSISDAETDAALEAEATVTWSVNLSDSDSRTMSADEIVQGYAEGLVTADAFVWKDGMADWVPLLESELAPLLGAAPEAEPEPAAAPPAQVVAPTATPRPVAASPTATPLPAKAAFPSFTAPVTATGTGASRAAATRASQPDNTQDLFGSVDTAGSEDDVATSAPFIPQAGTSAYDDGKLTGARNENSVLFSLDALKAGFSPSASPNASKPSPKAPNKAPGAARPQQPSNPDDPFGMGSVAGSLGSGGPLFGGDNQALLTAPAAPPPPAAVAAQFAAGPAAYGAAPAAKNNKLVVIGGGIGGVVIIGLLLALLLGKKSDDAPTADSSAAASASAAPVAVAEKPAEPEKKEEAPKPAEPAASAAPTASTAPETKPESKPSTTAVAAAPKKKEEAAPAPTTDAPFSKASAISALTSAANSAGSCKKPGGPTGAGKATVTFAPSGRVTTATVAGGSYAGTAVGGCVASVFRRAHVPAFAGSPVTVSKSFQIN